MKRRTLLQASLGCLGFFGAGAVQCRRPAAAKAGPGPSPVQWQQRHLLGLGTTLSIQVAHRDPVLAEKALDAAVATVRHVEAHMSLFDPTSALSCLNRDGVLKAPHPDLLGLLRIAQRVSARSGGAFDVTVQPLWNAFEAAQRASRLPTPHAVAQARKHVDWKALRLSPQTIEFQREGMSVTLNGIAQGYAADLVRTTLMAHGVQHALINTGEWSALGQPDPHQRWTLGIANPRDERLLLARLQMDGRCIATSSDSQTCFSSDFKNHHIFDPTTGYSPPETASVTVAAASAALADALTKVMFVAGPRLALHLAARWNVDVLLVNKAGQWTASAGLLRLPA